MASPDGRLVAKGVNGDLQPIRVFQAAKESGRSRPTFAGSPHRTLVDELSVVVSPPHDTRISCGINTQQRGFFADAHNLGDIHRARPAWRSARGRCDQTRRQATGNGQAQKPRAR
jgi:hypothetical protein